MRARTKYMLLAAAAGTVFATVPAFAQSNTPDDQAQAESGGVAEIIVTAQRKGENLQNVPIAVTAIGGDALQTRGISNLTSLEGTVPSLTMARTATSNAPYLRGVGAVVGAGVDEASVATYIDGYYIASPLSNQGGFNNLARIEVLKGPQGTLFGRNATGGVIQMVTKDPTEDPHADFSIGYGNYETVDANAYVTGGILPNLAADIAVQYHNQDDGFARNLTLGTDVYKDRTYSVRSKWVYTGENTKVTLQGAYENLRSSGLVLQYAPETRAVYGYPDTGRFDIATGKDPFQRAHKFNIGFRIEQDLGFANLISSSFFAKADQSYGAQYTTASTFGGFAADDHSKEYSQEFQLQGKGDSRLDWQLGAFLFKYKSDVLLNTFGPAFFGSAVTTATAQTSSVALYGQATYEIVTDLKLTGGFRYTWDTYKTKDSKVVFEGFDLGVPPNRSRKAEKPSWRLALDYQMSPDILGYVSYNRGIKSGGFSVYSPTAPGYNPEQLDAYEVGLKTQLFDRAVRFNLAGFYYDYKQLQVNVISDDARTSQIVNAATARVYGLDADFEIVPFKNLTISGGFGILDAKYKSFAGSPTSDPSGAQSFTDVSGKRMIRAPKFSGTASATYTIPTEIGDFKVSGSVTNKSVSYDSPDNSLVYPGYTVVNGVVGWTSANGQLGVDVWANNLFDEHYYAQKIATAPPFGWLQMAAPPRTYGVRLKAKF